MGRRHHSIIAKLNRNTKERKSLFRIQLKQLIELGSLITTVTKAKIIKRLFDRLAAKASGGTLSSRRLVAAELGSPKSANRLVDLIIPAMGGRRSGFTTIQKVGVRRGDSTSTASISLIVPLPETPKKEVKAEKVIKKK
ncbi:TPA: 50S ribosomal protein L17 [Candidatus Collierbacteria bacterium]|uniref:50S ribosomal protein L17 n=1 Tax=Candidatus Collierbacteria bacterium GW2011_GWB2_44_22 TaxID=1618387 RepID=A0A0G1K7Y9_9BACT|nr:MAG: 50S ribosomal protein L17 [Candidatus Collierbacteria bacterium GW2011_GWA2_44_13]KKT52432.1 MAG: 50S ribosomal protein L17 [Candidatus Collierbacteria bacterium GW2011_GWB2_44_22]KKT62884.1 MAG: 50S ribosomal protein L17 [Candidatus Collierbacteria bacterium GW2011_GWD1_44_27]KKT64406.1 MAG: 50S ribosomal protein L17 [Candidatus Collierbacteria bacterium GW2011_GWC2_44_30]KKT69334.1 MAG: 50S ribosomal protein L17 [Microgenomates group bacterium GW2011_GWC1_44_37]KKT88838.1 MAG: 50S ri